jgi:hypothetical protein
MLYISGKIKLPSMASNYVDVVLLLDIKVRRTLYIFSSITKWLKRVHLHHNVGSSMTTIIQISREIS